MSERRSCSLPALLLGLVACATAGCADSRTARPAGVGEPEDTVTVLYYSADPSTWTDFGQPVLTLLFSPLMHEHGWELEPRLARSREMSPDGRSWTYHLRTDATWQDGTPVTAHDIAFTVELFQNPDIGNAGAAQRGLGRRVTVHDDSTFTLTFDTWQRNDEVWTPREVFLPRHLLEDLDPDDFNSWAFWDAPVGNGPYRFVRMVPGQLIELEANPDYFGDRPAIERVFIRAMGNPRVELRAGEADAMMEIGPVTVAMFEEDSRFRIYSASGSRLWPMLLNHRHEILGDAAVRRALDLAIDRAELAASESFPPDLPLWDVNASPGQVVRGELPPLRPYDPDGARALLAAQGWEDTDGNGIRERDGRELRFDLIVGQYPAEVIQAQLRRVGVAVDLLPMDIEAARVRVLEGDFEASTGNWPGARRWPELSRWCQ
jgi:peptide/nickel transport system substrate-binding protein